MESIACALLCKCAAAAMKIVRSREPSISAVSGFAEVNSWHAVRDLGR